MSSTTEAAAASTRQSAYQNAEINQRLSEEDKIRLLRDMLRVRRFEEVSLKH